jgi:hypothetical protein
MWHEIQWHFDYNLWVINHFNYYLLPYISAVIPTNKAPFIFQDEP